MRSLTGLFLCALALTSCEPGQSTPVQTTSVDPDYVVPDFKLTERSGKTVTKSQLQGKVWIASFVFTRCSGPCPAVTSTMARLQSELSAVPDVRFVTFTVDPERDDPKELTTYANRFRADPEKWLFLTGPEKEIHSLMQEGFKVSVVKTANPKPGDEFDHSTRLVVVDKQGTIKGYYDGMPPDRPGARAQYEDGLQRLKARVEELLRE